MRISDVHLLFMCTRVYMQTAVFYESSADNTLVDTNLLNLRTSPQGQL
jgi:hypothetical protein